MLFTKNRIFIIAEIGTGHGGNMLRAKQLVDAAAAAGADCAKFQIVHPEEILHPDTGFVQLPGGPVRLFDRFAELEVSLSFFAEISAYCESKGLIFLCTPFGLRSARELKSLDPSCIKIASPELNHFPLLREVAGYGVPLILSSGVSLLSDIEKALGATEAANERILLHCITSYPAPEEEYNLNVLESLAAIFGISVGLSDHSLDPILVPILAAACGACIIEKHITLSRDDPGLDDPVALPASDFAYMVREVRAVEGMTKEAIVTMMARRYGDERVQKILGTGKKVLAPSEKANYIRTNRTIHFLRDLDAGHCIAEEDIALLRTEKVLTPGLSPEFFDIVLGATLVRDAKNGAGIEWEDIVQR